MNTIKFKVQRLSRYGYEDGHYVFEIVPEIEGNDLIKLVRTLEQSHNLSLAGTYGGIIPSFFKYGPLFEYYLGLGDPDIWNKDRKIAVLGCECGVAACWPLFVRVEMTEDTVTWSEFEPLHNDKEIYKEVGPFQFERQAYERAIKDALESIDRQDAQPQAGIIQRGKSRLSKLFSRTNAR